MKRIGLSAIVAMLILSACTSAESTPIVALPNGRCLDNKNCAQDEECQHPDDYYPCGICMDDPSLNECNGENPCAEGQSCIRVAPPCYCGYNVCVESCTISGCPAGQVCGDDDVCQALTCDTDDDCGGAYCIKGKCGQEFGYCESTQPRP